MTRSEIKDFTSGNITKQLLLFALPLFLSNLMQVFYNMIDMIVVGNVLGDPGISAVSVGGDISMLMTFISMGFASAAQVIIARYVGSRERDKISAFIGTMSGFLFVSAVVVSILGLIFRHQLLALMNTPAESYEGALAYSSICISGMVFIYGYNIVSAILRGMGDSKHPFVFISVAALTNVVLDLLFVLGLNMGAAGAALATVISQGVSFISCVIFLYIKRTSFELNIRISYFIRWNKEMLRELVGLGTPMAIKTASIQISKLFVNSQINSYGIAVSAFAGIANKISSISNLISAALNTAGSTLAGQNIVAGEFKRVRAILLNIAVIGLSVAAVLSALFLIFPTEIFSLFTKEASSEMLDIANGYLPIVVLLFVAGALRAVMNALINGSGNHRINFATAIFDGIVMRIGLSLLFGIALDMKHYGFWLGDALAGFTPFLIGVVFYVSGAWKRSAKLHGSADK